MRPPVFAREAGDHEQHSGERHDGEHHREPEDPVVVGVGALREESGTDKGEPAAEGEGAADQGHGSGQLGRA